MASEKHYRDEIYTEWFFDDATDCAVRHCTRPPDPDWYIWVTVHGREKHLRFCSVHGPEEAQNQRFYELGL